MVGCSSSNKLFAGIENVFFHTFLSDTELVKVYQNATLLILPLLEGASSQTLNEAMSSGLPVVTNDLPNLIDYIVEDAIFLSPIGNVEKMVKHCYTLLTNSNKLEYASKKGREHSKQYNYRNIRKTILNQYAEKLNFRLVDGSV